MARLDDLRRAFKIGMTKREFFLACDDLLPLKMSMPTVNENLVAIEVEEGGRVLFFLSDGEGLTYAEWDGGDFFA